MFKRWKSIKWKLLCGFVLVYLIAAACMVFFYVSAGRSIRETAQGTLNTSLRRQKDEAESTLYNARQFALRVAKDSDIQKVLREALPTEEQAYYSQRMTYNAQLHYLNQFEEEIQNCFVIGANGMAFKSAERSWLYGTDFREEDWYQKAVTTGETVWLSHRDGSFLVNELAAPVLTIVEPIFDRASSGILGVVVVDLAAESILPYDLVDQYQGAAYLLDEQDRILTISVGELGVSEHELQQLLTEVEDTQQTTTKAVEAGDTQQSAAELMEAVDPQQLTTEAASLWALRVSTDLSQTFSSPVRISGQMYLMSNQPLEVGGWKLTGLISYQSLYASLYRLRTMVIIVMLAATLIAVALALFLSESLTTPIRRLEETMQQVSAGHMEARVEVSSADEIGALSRHFNRMVARIDELMKKETENQEKLRKSEMNALQAQINPHFLYNALDSINWLARMKQNEEVISMINALSGFYRISLSRGRTYITLEEEFQHAEHYLSIQKVRYRKLLSWELTLPEELKKVLCLKMILQPLIENSIYHGIKEKGVPGVIRVYADVDESDVLIMVEDDGRGMTPEELTHLREMLADDLEYHQDAYGIINVARRLRMYFGPVYGISVDSVLNERTTVTVRIPGADQVPGQHPEG